MKLTICLNIDFWSKKMSYKDKDVPFTGHGGPLGMWMQGYTILSLWHEKIRVTSPMLLANFIPRKIVLLILKEVERTPRANLDTMVWEKSAVCHCLGSNPGFLARSKVLATKLPGSLCFNTVRLKYRATHTTF